MSKSTVAKRPSPPRRRKYLAAPRNGFGTPPNKRFLLKDEVLERIGGISFVTLNRWIREGKFPEAVTVGSNRPAWRESAIDHYMDTRPVRQYKPLAKRGK